MEGILALMIPVIALSTGLVWAIRMPREALAGKRKGVPAGDGADVAALAGEVAQLRLELAEMRERVEFTERLLTPAAAAPALLRAADVDARLTASARIDSARNG